MRWARTRGKPSIAAGILGVLVIAATACGGSDSAQRTTVAQTMTAPASQALDQEIAGLAALTDEGTAQIEASTDKRELGAALTHLTSDLVSAEARLRQLNVPADREAELDALIGALAHAEGSLGGDALARLATSSVEETKQFIQTYGHLDELRTAIDALQAQG